MPETGRTTKRKKDLVICLVRDKLKNSTRSNSIFENIIHKKKFGLMIVGKLVGLQEEVRKEDISIALIIREEFSTSVLFKDILEAISLIPRYRTMW